MRRSHRGGFSLLEVILATAILMGAAIVLGELAAIGRQHLESAEALTAAQEICRTKMAEMLCGAQPMQSVDKQPVEGNSGWVYSVDIRPTANRGIRQGPQLNLAVLQVTVEEDVPERENEETHHRQFTLTRLVRDVEATSSPDAMGSRGAMGGQVYGPDRWVTVVRTDR